MTWHGCTNPHEIDKTGCHKSTVCACVVAIRYVHFVLFWCLRIFDSKRALLLYVREARVVRVRLYSIRVRSYTEG